MVIGHTPDTYSPEYRAALTCLNTRSQNPEAAFRQEWLFAYLINPSSRSENDKKRPVGSCRRSGGISPP